METTKEKIASLRQQMQTMESTVSKMYADKVDMNDECDNLIFQAICEDKILAGTVWYYESGMPPHFDIVVLCDKDAKDIPGLLELIPLDKWNRASHYFGFMDLSDGRRVPKYEINIDKNDVRLNLMGLDAILQFIKDYGITIRITPLERDLQQTEQRLESLNTLISSLKVITNECERS